MKLILALVAVYTIQATNGYVATVINWEPPPTYQPSLIIELSVKKILYTINNKTDEYGTNIFIFPEYSLANKYTFELTSYPYQYALDVPDESTTSACEENSEDYFKQIACAAKANDVYVVMHAIERENDDLFNTIVVFDRQGAPIKKHRKVNLTRYELRYFKQGSTSTEFTSDFGTFTLLTSEDILLYDPKDQKSKNDVILCSSMESRMPFQNAIALFDGFSKKNQVNLLVATSYRTENGASGFYTIDTKDAKYYSEQYYALTAEIGAKSKVDICTRKDVKLTGILAMKTLNIDFYHYDTEFKYLVEGSNAIRLVSEDGKLACLFEVDVVSEGIGHLAAAAFSDWKTYGCAIVVCKTKDAESCGQIVDTTNEIRNVRIESKTADVDIGLFNYPISYSAEQEPIVQYNYCTDETGISLTAKGPLNNILTLGYFGREPRGRNGASIAQPASCLAMLLLLLYSLQFYNN